MYCSNCGTKVKKDSQFCSKCGTKVNQKQVEQTLTPSPKSSQFSRKKFFGLVLATMIAASAAVYAVSNRQPQLQTPLLIISSILSGILIIWIVVAILRSLFKLSVSTFTSSKNLVLVFLKHPVIGTLMVAALAILIFLINFYVSDYEYKQMQKALGPIQDQGAEVAVAKSNKDSYSAKLISDRLSKLETARRLNDYKLAIKLWADATITGSAQDDPGPFVLNLTADQAQNAFKAVLTQIVQTKEFGDDAIKRGDRITMRFVAAKILIQGHWLQGIAQSADPGFLSLSPGTVFAADGIRPKLPVVTRKRNPCLTHGKRVCLNDVTKIIQGIYRSALGYGVGDKDATKEWNDNWSLVAPIIEAFGQPIGGSGITEGSKNEPQYPKAVQSFLDECKAKGGYIGGGVKERLPTTEDGRTCRYQQDKCWDFLTYSGGRYKGGNPGCEEQGLLPKPPPYPAPKQKQNINQNNNQGGSTTQPPTSASWDGVYQVTTNINCSHDAPFQIPGIDHLSPFSDTITVRNNSIINPNGGSYPIGSSKQVTIPFQTDAGVGVSLSFNQTFNFFPTGDGGAGVNGQISIQAHSSVETVNFNLNCNGSFSGRRVSP